MQVSVSSKWVMAVRLQVSHGWQLTLLWTLERWVGHMDGFKESFRPCCWLCRLKHNRLAVLTDGYVCRQVYALGQANGLAISVEDDNCCFHAGKSSQNSGQDQASRAAAPSTTGTATVQPARALLFTGPSDCEAVKMPVLR